MGKCKLLFANKIKMCLIICSVIFVTLAGVCSGLHPDFGLNPVELITKHGYPVESHEVQTEDGYLLTMHRIPYGVKNQDKNRPAVLVMHGLLSNSADWVNMGPDKALAYLLADAGYDVWLGNQRGNTWSRKHVSLDPDKDSKQFFMFSFHEIGVYDIPAKIDYILNTTKQEKLNYIGHSQGTAVFFVMCSVKPEYNEKITIMSALAPVAYVEHAAGPIVKLLHKYFNFFQQFMWNSFEFMPFTESLKNLGRDLCGKGILAQELCASVLFSLAGWDSDELDRNFLPVIVSNTPAGASVRQFFHFMQILNSTEFKQYDYYEGNMEKYGQSTPPLYNISKITAPMVLHYGANDYLSSTTDVEKFASEVPNAKLKLVPHPKWEHLDYLWATDIVELLNNDIVQELDIVNK